MSPMKRVKMIMEEDLPSTEHQKNGDTPVPGRKEIEPTLAFKLEPTLA
jgi:hypothetical protein